MEPDGFRDPNFLARLRSRESAAVESVVETYLPQLLRTARGMGFTQEEGEDLAQGAFTALIESLERFEGRSHIRTFLFGIFYNKVSEHLRRLEKSRREDSIDQTMESRFDEKGAWRQPPVDLERAFLSQEVGRIVTGCLEELPQAQRVAFYLREVDGLETKELCKKLEVSGTNLGVLLFRARNRLRECLEAHGIKRKG